MNQTPRALAAPCLVAAVCLACASNVTDAPHRSPPESASITRAVFFDPDAPEWRVEVFPPDERTASGLRAILESLAPNGGWRLSDYQHGGGLLLLQREVPDGPGPIHVIAAAPEPRVVLSLDGVKAARFASPTALVCSSDAGSTLIDALTGEPLCDIPEGARGVAASPDGRWLLWRTKDERVFRGAIRDGVLHEISPVLSCPQHDGGGASDYRLWWSNVPDVACVNSERAREWSHHSINIREDRLCDSGPGFLMPYAATNLGSALVTEGNGFNKYRRVRVDESGRLLDDGHVRLRFRPGRIVSLSPDGQQIVQLHFRYTFASANIADLAAYRLDSQEHWTGKPGRWSFAGWLAE